MAASQETTFYVWNIVMVVVRRTYSEEIDWTLIILWVITWPYKYVICT